jgi:hypothetical protein
LFPLLANIIDETSLMTRFDILALMEKYFIINNDWSYLKNMHNKMTDKYNLSTDLHANDINNILAILPLLYKQCTLIKNTIMKILN